MRRIRWVVLILLVIMMPISVRAEMLTGTDEEILEIADPMLDNILLAMKNMDYEQYSTNFAFGQAISKPNFEKTTTAILESTGEYQTRTYLGCLKYQDMTLVLWKASFSKIPDDVLIKLYLSKEDDGVVYVKGLWFK